MFASGLAQNNAQSTCSTFMCAMGVGLFHLMTARVGGASQKVLHTPGEENYVVAALVPLPLASQ